MECSSGKYSAGGSEDQIGDLDELVAVDDPVAPDGVEIGERLFRNCFLGGFSRELQFLNAIAGSDEHVPEFRKVRFVAEPAVSRDNLSVIVGEREDFVTGGNITISRREVCFSKKLKFMIFGLSLWSWATSLVHTG